MLRADFDAYPIWSVLEQIQLRSKEVRSLGDTADLNALETIEFLAAHIAAFKEMGSTASPFFSAQMMEPVLNLVQAADANMQNRINTSSSSGYLEAVRDQLESALIPMAPWPRPYGRGGQIRQQTTLFEELLESQRMSLQVLQAKHAEFLAEVAAFRQEIVGAKNESVAELQIIQSTAASTSEAVDGEKARIDELVVGGTKAIADLQTQFNSGFRSWTDEAEAAFGQRFDPLSEEITRKADVADEMLAKLESDESEYVNLTSAVAAGNMANHFQAEARNSRLTGIGAYVLGLAFIVLGSLPLIWSALNPERIEDSTDLANWTHVVTRIAVAAAGVTAATVVFRLGSRFISEAGSSKRMELELRTFGPFLANVGEQERVDSARLEWVDRAFGASVLAATEKDADVIEVSAFSKLVDSVVKLVGR